MKHSEKLPDDLNPEYIFSTTDASLLVNAINGKIDLNIIAIKELANRGLNQNGKWIGFTKAEEEAEKAIGLLK